MRDFTYSIGCGCQVTFFAEAEYRTSRMTCGECCGFHKPKGMGGIFAREVLMDDARVALAEYRTKVAGLAIGRNE